MSEVSIIIKVAFVNSDFSHTEEELNMSQNKDNVELLRIKKSGQSWKLQQGDQGDERWKLTSLTFEGSGTRR